MSRPKFICNFGKQDFYSLIWCKMTSSFSVNTFNKNFYSLNKGYKVGIFFCQILPFFEINICLLGVAIFILVHDVVAIFHLP